MQLAVNLEQWPLVAPFKIAGHTFTCAETVVVTVRDGELQGRGEAASVFYLGVTPESIADEVESVRKVVEQGIRRDELQRILPAGGARNALDCALWELDSHRSRMPVWRLASLNAPPRPRLTTYTLGADTPETMAGSARRLSAARALKLKLMGDGADAERVAAVRAVRPDVWIGVDANQSLTRATLVALLPTLIAARVALIEQPLPIGCEADLEDVGSPIPIAADESLQTLADVPNLVGRFHAVNIKLDKCGGLTEALAIVREAQRLGLKVMVGNMFGTSLAMAPAFVVAQLCDVVDLDGPILFVKDRLPSVRYSDGHIWCSDEVWGFASPALPRIYVR